MSLTQTLQWWPKSGMASKITSLFLSLFRLVTKAASKLCIAGPLGGKSTEDLWIPLTRASDAESLSMSSWIRFRNTLSVKGWKQACVGCSELFPDNIPFSPEGGRPFVIADYGCRDGGVSVPLFQHLIGTVKPVYNDHLMGYFSAFWSSSRWPRPPRWAPECRNC